MLKGWIALFCFGNVHAAVLTVQKCSIENTHRGCRGGTALPSTTVQFLRTVQRSEMKLYSLYHSYVVFASTTDYIWAVPKNKQVHLRQHRKLMQPTEQWQAVATRECCTTKFTQQYSILYGGDFLISVKGSKWAIHDCWHYPKYTGHRSDSRSCYCCFALAVPDFHCSWHDKAWSRLTNRRWYWLSGHCPCTTVTDYTTVIQKTCLDK